MEDKVINFDGAFKILSFAMNINNTHPFIKRDSKWTLKVGTLNIIVFLMFCFIVYCTISIDLKDGNITQAFANGIICLIFLIGAYKFFIMQYYRDIMVDLIKKVNLDFEKAQHLPESEKLIIQKFIKKGQVMTRNWFLVITATACLFLMKSIGMMIYYTVVDEFKLVHLFEMTYPPAIEDIKNTWFMFILLYAVFIYYDVYIALMFVGFFPLGSVLTLHSCGQLELARSRVLTLFQNDNTDEEIIEQIKSIAKLLQDILSFIDIIKVSFTIFYELTLKVTSVIIPVTLFQIIESMKKGELRVEFLTVLFTSACLSSIPCYYSEMLMEAGKRLNLAIYECGWERHWNPKSRKLLFLLFIRTSKSMALRTVFLDVCLEALTGVFQMSYTIFNLLNAT